MLNGYRIKLALWLLVLRSYVEFGLMILGGQTHARESDEGKKQAGCTILVVDDDAAMRSLLIDELSDGECQVIEAIDGHHAFSQLKTMTPDLIITDLKMPGGGYDYLRMLRDAVPSCPILLVTAFADSQTKNKVIDYGMVAYFDKPVRIADLKAAICQVCPAGKSQTCKNNVE